MGLFGRNKSEIVSAEDALPGRSETMPVAGAHLLTQNPMLPPYPDNMGQIIVGMGCFWGAERKFWEAPGVWSTAVGYIGGHTPNPSYQEVCSGRTGHTEAVLAIFDTSVTSYDDMLTRLRLKQAYGRLIRRATDRGVFVLLDPMMPSRLGGAFPDGVEMERVGLADAVAACKTLFSHPKTNGQA